MSLEQANHVRGETNPVAVVKASGTVWQPGDLILRNSGDSNCYAAAGITWNTNLATTQADAKAVFVGVALNEGVSGTTDGGLVATTGDFVYTLDSGTPLLGASLGIAKAAGNNLVSRALVGAVATSAVATTIGLIGTTQVVARIHGQLHKPV